MAPQQEQKLTADELSEPDTAPRVMPVQGERSGEGRKGGRQVILVRAENFLLLSGCHVLRHGEEANSWFPSGLNGRDTDRKSDEIASAKK